MPKSLSDHETDFTLVLDLFGLPGQLDRLSRADDAGRRLEKEQRLFGRVVAELFRVLDIVAADADDLGRAFHSHVILRSVSDEGSAVRSCDATADDVP